MHFNPVVIRWFRNILRIYGRSDRKILAIVIDRNLTNY
jgi:hypothetical protein